MTWKWGQGAIESTLPLIESKKSHFTYAEVIGESIFKGEYTAAGRMVLDVAIGPGGKSLSKETSEKKERSVNTVLLLQLDNGKVLFG